MAGSVNKVILVGNLGADPEIRNNGAGEPIVNLRVATNESWTDKKSGDRKEKVEWHRVEIFGQLAKVVEGLHLAKGTKIWAEGALQTRKWEKNGVDQYSTEIVLQGFGASFQVLDGKGEGNRPPPASSPDDYGTTSSRPSNGAPAGGGFDDGDIPFICEAR